MPIHERLAEALITLVARGRWYVRHELQGTTQLKKYRALKQRYYGADTAEHEREPELTAMIRGIQEGG